MVNIHTMLTGDDEYRSSFENRFWDKVDKSGDCWEWTASTDGSGYGKITYKQTLIGAHRVAKYLDEEEDISDKQVNHTCHNRSCVNPEHLYLGTQQSNIIDTVNRGTHNNQKLSADDVKEIRQKYESSETTYQKLADEYDVCRQTVGFIIRGDNWSHVS